MMLKIKDAKGFTLIELMLAMTVFSAVMVIATVGFIGMNRTFNRGLIRKELSEYSQTLTEDITRTVRGMGSNAYAQKCTIGEPGPDCASTDFSAICFETARYTWGPDANNSGLKKDNSSNCGGSVEADAREIVSSRYVVRKLDIEMLSGEGVPNNLFSVSGVLSTADDEALNLDPSEEISCRGTAEAATVRTCAVEKFSFVINARGN